MCERIASGGTEDVWSITGVRGGLDPSWEAPRTRLGFGPTKGEMAVPHTHYTTGGGTWRGWWEAGAGIPFAIDAPFLLGLLLHGGGACALAYLAARIALG